MLALHEVVRIASTRSQAVHIVVMIASTDFSQEVFTIDFLIALKTLLRTWSQAYSGIVTTIWGHSTCYARVVLLSDGYPLAEFYDLCCNLNTQVVR